MPELPEKYINIVPLTPGRNATVFRARDAQLRRDVFLKVYPVPAADPQSALNEPQLLCQLNHPNLVKIHSLDQLRDGNLVLEMELIADGTIKDRMVRVIQRKRMLRVHTTLSIVSDVVSGLAHLHSHGFVHRDIKPANILLNRAHNRREGIVTDLGLASRLNQQGEAHASRHARWYRPPEVWNGEPYTTASDVYQVGLVLYEMLGGTVDLSKGNATDAELRDLTASFSLVDIDSVPPHISREVRTVLRRCICARPSRIQRMQDLSVELLNLKTRSLNWGYTWTADGFALDRAEGPRRLRINGQYRARDCDIRVHKRISGGQWRQCMQPVTITHPNLGRCRRFKEILECRL